MENDILELREEIDYLNERINILERKNRRIQSHAYLKIIVKIILLILFVIGILKGYEYISNELPKLVEEKINEINPIKIKN